MRFSTGWVSVCWIVAAPTSAADERNPPDTPSGLQPRPDQKGTHMTTQPTAPTWWYALTIIGTLTILIIGGAL